MLACGATSLESSGSKVSECCTPVARLQQIFSGYQLFASQLRNRLGPEAAKRVRPCAALYFISATATWMINRRQQLLINTQQLCQGRVLDPDFDGTFTKQLKTSAILSFRLESSLRAARLPAILLNTRHIISSTTSTTSTISSTTSSTLYSPIPSSTSQWPLASHIALLHRTMSG